LAAAAAARPSALCNSSCCMAALAVRGRPRPSSSSAQTACQRRPQVSGRVRNARALIAFHNLLSKRRRASITESCRELQRSHVPYAPTGVTPRQFAAIVAYVHPTYPPEETAGLYRDAFTLGRGTVNYDSFTAAAEARQFFSSAMRLPPLVFGASSAAAAASVSPLTRAQCAELAFIVDGHWRALEFDLAPWLAQVSAAGAAG
jgi:hypothetical protein